MKTYKNIFPRVCAYDNLYFAWRDAARCKRKSPEVAAFEYALIDNLLRLEAELREARYRPGPYRHFRITYPKPRRTLAPALARSASAGGATTAPWTALNPTPAAIATPYLAMSGNSSHQSITPSYAASWPKSCVTRTSCGWWTVFWRAGWACSAMNT